MGGACSTPVKLVDAVVVGSEINKYDDGSVGGGYNIALRLKNGKTGTDFGSLTELKPGLVVTVAVDRSGGILHIEDPQRPMTYRTRKGTLVSGYVSCKSDALVSKICQGFLLVLCALAIAGLVSGKIDWISSILLNIIGSCVCSASVFSGIPRDFIATRIYDEK
jgi:hypothetical protein